MDEFGSHVRDKQVDPEQRYQLLELHDFPTASLVLIVPPLREASLLRSFLPIEFQS